VKAWNHHNIYQPDARRTALARKEKPTDSGMTEINESPCW